MGGGKAEESDRLEAKLQKHLEQFFTGEDLINFDVQPHRKITVVCPTIAPTNAEEARAHREEVLPPDIEEVYEPYPDVQT